MDKMPRTFLFDQLDFHWQMSRAEQFALQALLQYSQPEVAIEIGTYQGGSLQILAQQAQQVYSLDIDPQVKTQLGSHFPNVDFISGDSAETLPALVNQLNASQASVGFVLIDGDHSALGVRRDINALLQLRPQRDIIVVMHDSFNPSCRLGIQTAAWQDCPYVSWMELDYITGTFYDQPLDTASERSMWGGFAVAHLTPEPQTDRQISAAQQGLFQAIFQISSHRRTLPNLLRTVKHKLVG
jgi:trans-aconitate methyltransferase